MAYAVLWKTRLLDLPTMPPMGLQLVVDVAHAVSAARDVDWDAVVPLCGRRPVPAIPDPNRDFTVVPNSSRCAECEAIARRE